MLRINKKLLAVQLGLLVTLFMNMTLLSAPTQAYDSSVKGAQEFADYWCKNSGYGDNAMADYMWITNPKSGGLNFTVVEGKTQTVDVTVNFYTTYCASWPNDSTAYGNELGVFRRVPNAKNRLSSDTTTVNYDDRVNGSGREEHGPIQFSGKLDLSGLATGDYEMCTSFASHSDYAVESPASTSACFTVGVTRTYPWSTSGESKVGVAFTPPNVSDWTAKPNQMLYWQHKIYAEGSTTPQLDFAVGKSGFSGSNVWGTGLPANHNQPIGKTSQIAAGSSYTVGWGTASPNSDYSEYKVLPSDGGRTLCQSISWGPSDYEKKPGDAWASSDDACVTVPYNYELTPNVSGLNGVTTVGAPLPPINPSISNVLPDKAADTTDSPTVHWEMKRIEVPAGNTIAMTSADNATAPCAHYGYTCIDKPSGDTVFPGNNTTNLPTLTSETAGADNAVGSQICYTLSVRPYREGGAWRHSAPVCVMVSKQPKVQVWGGDLRTRGQIRTGVTATTTKTFGSWVEYGGFAAKGINGFASGSGLNNGNDSPAQADWSKLSFANVNKFGSNSFGNFTLPALPAITSQFIGTVGGPPASDLGSLPSGAYNAGPGNFEINDVSNVGQSPDGTGKSIIIVSTGTVTIKKNITYSAPGAGGTFSNARELPQVVIIARNINIENEATQVDAWLLTTGDGAVNTCSDVQPVTRPLNSKVCDKPLIVNGPVATQHLYLRRTAGSDTVATAGAPAEVFNLRSDAYVWAYARAAQAGKAQTVYSVELPPRF